MFLGLLLLGIYFFTRFIAIRTLPPFNDEFIYVRWAQEGYFDAAKRLVSLTDGKQPLYIWLTSLMMNVISSPLAAGKIVSILSGAATMVGLGIFSYQLFKSRAAAYVTSFLYIVYPHALLLDRFALYDSMLASLWIWNMLLMYRLTQYPNLGSALLLALTLGAALLVKSSAMFLFIMLPVAAICFSKKGNIIRIFSLSMLASIVSLLYQSVIYLSPAVGMVMEKNNIFIYTWQELGNIAWMPKILTDTTFYWGWITSYLSWPIVFLVGAVPFLDRKHIRAYAFLLLAFVIPFAAIAVFGKTVYPRHLFFFTVQLLIVAGSGVSWVWQKFSATLFRAAILVVIFGPMIITSGRILADYTNAPLPSIDRFQYIEGWPAGWGVKDIAKYLENRSHEGPITILTEGLFGSMTTTAMSLYLGDYPQVRILPIDDEVYTLPTDIDWTGGVYAILNKAQSIPKAWNAEEVMKIRKGNGDSVIRLLKLMEPKAVFIGKR